MSSTEFRQGYNESKPTSRVLKPPGGGSSNIFGLAPAPLPTPESKVDPTESKIPKEHENSQIAGTSSEKTDTNSNLFREEIPQMEDNKNSASKMQISRNPITGLPYGTNPDIAETRKKGSPQDPIANKGETSEANEISHTRKSHPSTRVSQPPGGHCHKLW